jgi:hypothetical protein
MTLGRLVGQKELGAVKEPREFAAALFLALGPSAEICER